MSAPDPLDDLAAGELDQADEQVLLQLAGVYRQLDPVPAGLVERIQFGITLDALHAELAELQRTDLLAGVRGEDTANAQTVTFTSANLTTMVTITVLSAERVRIDGWAAPGGGVHVELRVRDDVLRTTADADGRFVFDDVPRGLAQFVVRHPAPSTLPPVMAPPIEL
jgi:hypothetical protein